MKKLIITTLSLVAGITMSYGQGGNILNTTSGLVSTAGALNGLAGGATASYYYEVLDMNQTKYAGLTGGQQAGLTTLTGVSSELNLWTDSTVGGNNTSLHAGGVAGAASAAGNTASSWAAPTPSAAYNTASSYDYYIVVGWSSSEGTTWATVASELAGNSLVVGGYFGDSAVAYNYAGIVGGSPGPVSVWATSSATGLAGSGGLTGMTLNQVVATPEPASMVLAGLGGLSLLALRRKK